MEAGRTRGQTPMAHKEAEGLSRPANFSPRGARRSRNSVSENMRANMRELTLSGNSQQGGIELG